MYYFFNLRNFLVNFVDNQQSTRPRSQSSLLPVPGNEVAQHNEQHTGVQYVQYIGRTSSKLVHFGGKV